MENTTKSVNDLIKSLFRLQLLKRKAKNNSFNIERNYFAVSKQNYNQYFSYNNCENTKLMLNNCKSNNNSRRLTIGLRNLSRVNLDNIKSNQDSTQINKDRLIIYDSQCPLYVANQPSSVNKPTESNTDEVEIDDKNEFLNDKTLSKYKIPGPLEICNEDISHLEPYIQPTFNFAAYANQSETIQQLIKLGVKLYEIERYPDSMKSLLRRDFNEIKVYIQFLNDCRVHSDDIGSCLTKFPLIIDQDLDDLHTRIRYLRAHKFSIDDIQRIVTVCPQWLGCTTKQVDRKLGFFQTELKLSGEQVRRAFVIQPKLIIARRTQLRENFFSVKEEMYFNEDQIKKIVLAKPSLFINDRKLFARTFDYVHNQMEISHDLLAEMPTILLAPVSKIAERHEFLKLLKRDQYDPKKPLFVNLDALSRISDHEFSTNIAKTSIQLFDMFLKTR